jgi:uncharacterized protein YndB with AHSA1/START domain
MSDRSTRVRLHLNAPSETVFHALVDSTAVSQWMVPEGMTNYVHTFESREGGAFRISLTYDEPSGAGKTSQHSDTYRGRFVRLVPNELVEEVVEFETANPSMRGEMTITFSLTESNGGTKLHAVHDYLPPGLSGKDNETGW